MFYLTPTEYKRTSDAVLIRRSKLTRRRGKYKVLFEHIGAVYSLQHIKYTTYKKQREIHPANMYRLLGGDSSALLNAPL